MPDERPDLAYVIHVDDVAPQRWRNGGGWTCELLALPAAHDWQLRISVADVEADGPFSAFPGVTRWFAVLQGGGVDLAIDGAIHRVRTDSSPLCFEGGATTTCRLLDGPTRDLNVMLRGADGALARVEPGQSWRPRHSGCGLFTAVAGRCITATGTHSLPAEALLWFDQAPARLTFEPASPTRQPGFRIEANVRGSPP